LNPGVGDRFCSWGELALADPAKRNNPPRRIKAEKMIVTNRNRLCMMNL
jgi:hypothetical protein